MLRHFYPFRVYVHVQFVSVCVCVVLNVLQALSSSSVFLTFLQSANDTEQLSSCCHRAKKEGVQLKEQERGNENKVIKLSLLCFLFVFL